jgi:CDP-diacylglycerol--serine O-phosphatidyltransferase
MNWIAWFVTLFAGLSMVSDLRFYSGKEINLKNSVPFVVILLIVLAFVLISYSPPEVLFFVALVYGLSGYVLWLMQYSARKKASANPPENLSEQ